MSCLLVLTLLSLLLLAQFALLQVTLAVLPIACSTS
jgi:hypothetical protein